MFKLQTSVEIKAPRPIVWKVLWDDATFRDWASVFTAGSYIKSDWTEGGRFDFFDSSCGDGSYGPPGVESIVNSLFKAGEFCWPNSGGELLAGHRSIDQALVLRKIWQERMHFRKKLRTHVTVFPSVIDSRGRTLRPPPVKDAPGLLKGMPVSAGVVNGRVKVIHRADEKPVEEGDVLVAYTRPTRAGPLFATRQFHSRIMNATRSATS